MSVLIPHFCKSMEAPFFEIKKESYAHVYYHWSLSIRCYRLAFPMSTSFPSFVPTAFKRQNLPSHVSENNFRVHVNLFSCENGGSIFT